MYAVWHSPLVRSNLTLDDVDFTVLAATSVLDDLIVFCPPARACRDAFSRMTKATIKMCLATTGFGQTNRLDSGSAIDPSLQSYESQSASQTPVQQMTPLGGVDPNNPNFPYAPPPGQRKSMFDTDLQGLFSEEETQRRMSTSLGMPYQMTPQMQSGPGYNPLLQSAVRADVPQIRSPGGQVIDGTYAGADQTFQNPFPQRQTVGMESQNQQFGQIPVSPWSELDFLDSVSIPDTLNINSNDPAVDPLGVGFAWDGSVPGMDWGDGSGSVDVFDGFFFGGTGMGTGYGGTSGMEMMDMKGQQ